MFGRGRTALITGAGSGIGRETALVLARQGVEVAVFDLNADHATQTVTELQQLSGRAVALSGDIRRQADVDRAVKAAAEVLGHIDIAVNCAGILIDRTIPKLTEEIWDKVMAVNLKGCFLLIQSVMPLMAENGYGRIVTLSSGAYLGNFGQAAYGASKAGVVSLTKTAALECARHGVTVNCVAPGLVKTPMTNDIPPEVFEKLAKGIPLRRVAEPRDIAAAIAHLVADDAGYLTGQIVHVDGGATTGIRL